jgi:hypothetical protein
MLVRAVALVSLRFLTVELSSALLRSADTSSGGSGDVGVCFETTQTEPHTQVAVVSLHSNPRLGSRV